MYSVLTREALPTCVECTSGLVGGNGLSITFKLGLKRSIQHIRFSRTTVISAPQNGEVARNRSLEDRDRTPPVKKISSAHHNTASAFLAPHQITSFMPVQKGSYEQRVPGAAEKRDTKNGPRRQGAGLTLSSQDSVHGDQAISAKCRRAARLERRSHVS